MDTRPPALAASVPPVGHKPAVVRPARGAAGGTGGDHDYKGIITSYDYDAAISEAGGYGQPGIGGPNKFEVNGCMQPQVRCCAPDRACPHSSCCHR